MKFQLDALYVTLIAALGLELGCAVSPTASEAGESDDSGATAGDGDSTTGDGDGEPPPPAPFECEGETPVLQAGTDQPSGFVMCGNGFIHRKEKIDALDLQGLDEPACALDEFATCKTAADCTGDYARCIILGGDIGCGCDNGCASDADCSPSEVCAPAGVAGGYSTCIPGACKIDDECGEGLCGLSLFQHCCGPAYQTVCAEQDELCHVNSDCPDAPCTSDPGGVPYPYHCAVEAWPSPADGVWQCLGYGPCGCDCGRPFFVDGHARVAPASERLDWCRAPAREPRPVDAALRVRLAEHWAEIARFEHASIASFARVGLQLMQLGAPPNLLRDTSQALRDEIEHARIAFGLASAYAGVPIGPGSLAVGDAIGKTLDLHEIVDGLITEACVGETLAAIEAREAACWAEDPEVAAALERIAADEWEHARLGWRTLGWLLTRSDDGTAKGGECPKHAALREFAVTRLQAAIAASWSNAVEPVPPGDTELRRHGVLDPALRDEVRRAGIAKVLRPCVAVLERDNRADWLTGSLQT